MSLQSLVSELSSSDDDVFSDEWNIRENVLCRGLGDGSSRSTSPYIGDSVKMNDYPVTAKKMPIYLDEEVRTDAELNKTVVEVLLVRGGSRSVRGGPNCK